MQHFDNSEFRSWLSSGALADVIRSLNSSGELRILAHSMGNVATGEALNQYDGSPRVHSYIACQAALSAHYYDSGIAATHPCGHQALDPFFPSTPDIIGHFTSGQSETVPYLTYAVPHVQNMQNWFNGVDWALDHWEANNVLKPDGALGYLFSYIGRKDIYREGQDCFFGGPKIEDVPLSLMDLDERYMIFAYAVESRSRALGQTGNNKFNNWNLETGIGYDDQHYSHSREFRSNIVDEWNFWREVMKTCVF
jgi:hypothetical protein